MPEVIDNVAVAKLYGEPLFTMPHDLYIPPDALEVFLEAFEGPLDLLLYLIPIFSSGSVSRHTTASGGDCSVSSR